MTNEPTPTELLVSPWVDTFDTFANSITRSAILVSPYITPEPLERLSRYLTAAKSVTVEVLTNLAVDSMIQGATSPRALVAFSKSVPSVRVRHLPGLHAKVYVADRHLAIVTSANLTKGGLYQNYEYGVQITNPKMVRRIVEDVEGYSALGAEISLIELTQLAETTEELQKRHSQILSSARRKLRDAFEEQMSIANDSLLYLRAKSSGSNNAIFSRTILYLLRHGSLSTKQLHPLIQNVHPDLCDDTIDRVISGVHFGKRWKHMVRNAQQSLKNQGLITFDGKLWRLTSQ